MTPNRNRMQASNPGFVGSVRKDSIFKAELMTDCAVSPSHPGWKTLSADMPAAVGGTPLVLLRRASEATGCEIYGKAEFMNPGGSVKDRAALAIIEDAEKRGILKPGGTLVKARRVIPASG